MPTPIQTVSDRIDAVLVQAEMNGNHVVSFYLGQREKDGLLEFCDPQTYRMMTEGEPLRYRGVPIVIVSKDSYFAYELVELAR